MNNHRDRRLLWRRVFAAVIAVLVLVEKVHGAPTNQNRPRRTVVPRVTADDDDDESGGLGANGTRTNPEETHTDLVRFTTKRDPLRDNRLGQRGNGSTSINNNFLIGTVSGRVHYIDGESGDELWSFQTGGPLYQTSYSPVIPSLNGSIYMYSDRGLKKFPMSIREIVSHAPFVMDDGIFYLGTKTTNLYAIDTESGEVFTCHAGNKNWRDRQLFGGGAFECGRLPDSAVLVGRSDYTIHAIDERTGEERWNMTVGEYTNSMVGRLPNANPNHLLAGGGRGNSSNTAQTTSFVSGFDGSLQLIDSVSGRTVWSTLLSSPAVHVVQKSPSSSFNAANIFFKEQVLMIISRSADKVWVAEHDGQLFALEHSARPIASPIRDRLESLLQMNIVAPPSFLPLPAPGDSGSGSGEIYAPPTYNPLRDEQCTDENERMCFLGLHPLVCEDGHFANSQGLCEPEQQDNTNLLLPEPTNPAAPAPNADGWGKYIAIFATILVVIGALVAYARSFMLPTPSPVQSEEENVPLWKRKQMMLQQQKKQKKQQQQQQRPQSPQKAAPEAEPEGTEQEVAEPVANDKEKEKEETKPIQLADGKLQVGKLIVDTNAVLGYGSSGTVVYEGTLNGRRVAVKRMLKAFYNSADTETKLLIESDEHPNVVRYFASEDDSQFVYLALSHAETTLDRIVDEPEVFSTLADTLKLDMLRQIVRGVMHLHQLNIVHRDLKPQNILISSNPKNSTYRAKISDMGLAKKLEQERASFSTTASRGTVGWQAPEILGRPTRDGASPVTSPSTSPKMTKKVDIFALGCIFYYLLTGKHPFGDRVERELNVMTGKYNLDATTNQEARDLVSKMIDSNPANRPDAEEILLHPFFWGADRKLLFLRDTSDFMEFEKPTAPIVLALEQAASNEHVIPGGDWLPLLSDHLLQDLNRFRKYNGTKLRDLLRIIRNKAHHYRDLPPELQQQLGSLPDGYLKYFLDRFPQLVIFSFRFVRSHCREDKAFADYFNVNSVHM